MASTPATKLRARESPIISFPSGMACFFCPIAAVTPRNRPLPELGDGHPGTSLARGRVKENPARGRRRAPPVRGGLNLGRVVGFGKGLIDSVDCPGL